ncbi:MAG TPA: hypothetical protein VHH34_01650 [Pseudonocardiaceae bacterium]|nr:hypothetical protein [Pseudonocardiaceae bacterium]
MGSPGFTAIADGIRVAARQAAAAGEGARRLDLGAVATSIGQALRGTRSAAAAHELSTTWDTALATWSADVAEHARRLTDSAAGYETSDVQGADRFRAGPNRVR